MLSYFSITPMIYSRLKKVEVKEGERQIVTFCQKVIIILSEENTFSMYLGYCLAVSFHERNISRGIFTIENFTRTLDSGERKEWY